MSHYYFFVEILLLAVSNIQIPRINLMPPNSRYYCKTNYAKPFACPCRIFRIALHSLHLPLILSIVPFLCETMDSRDVAYYIPPCLTLLWPPRLAQFLVLKFRRRWSRLRAATMRREREHEKGNSDIADLRFYIYHIQRTVTHTYAWYFVIKYTINAMYKQTTKYTWYKILK